MDSSRVYYLHIGGVVAVGFDPTEAYMLVVTHSGRGVFDTGTWERVARDNALAYPEGGFSVGIGPIDGMKIPVVVMYWDTYENRVVDSPSSRIRLFCESSGIGVL